MRKRIISQETQQTAPADKRWLDLERLAQVELTSEDPAFPIESALRPGAGPGWRAAQPGAQTVRLLFAKPQSVQRIHLVFQEEERVRTQEFVLRWSPDGGTSYREIARQQYNFSPSGATREVEDYRVELDGVTALELNIDPDIGGAGARASMAELRLS